ncbi:MULTISPECIES: nuclease [unclassified Streptomyces]|uniref:nuclease n=1 Tax=unclassified Streptomyces TaxID=2593676 RepID=UPI00364BFB34
MIDPIQILWSPAGATMPALGSRPLVDVHDGDTPNFRMPIRMLSVDTPEVTADTAEGAAQVDQNFVQLAEWIRQGVAPITPGLAEFVLPKLETGKAGSLQFEQGTAAKEFNKKNINDRLARPGKPPRNLFIRMADSPFDPNHRLLAYIAPSYSAKELATLSREERATFNLDLVTKGWSPTFIIYPSIPGELDLPIMLAAAEKAVAEKRGIWEKSTTLLAYEYRALEDLFSVTKRKVEGDKKLRPSDLFSWRERYCVDMRTRVLHGPEDWFRVDPVYRLFLWPWDVSEAVGRLNLTPSPRLVGAD